MAPRAGRMERLRIAHAGLPDELRGVREVATEFNRHHSDTPIDVVAVEAQEWDEFHSRILTEMAAGSPPDLVYVVTEDLGPFADRLAEPLDPYVVRDRGELRDYFTDVHPMLIESMMHEGSLFALPIEFNAANMYYSTSLFDLAGLSRPADNWTQDDFSRAVLQLDARRADADFASYGWVNRLWGGLLPWIYAAGSNLLEEESYPGGGWLWNDFYSEHAERAGGWRWGAPRANDPRNADALQFLVNLTAETSTSHPDKGHGQSLIGEFTRRRLGMTPAGGFWSGRLHDSGMPPDAFDVQFFPAWTTQRHQFGSAGYVITKQARDKDLAWEWIKFVAGRPAMEILFRINHTTPSRRSMATAHRYAATGPRHWQVFYDTLDRFPGSAPVPAPMMSTPISAVLTSHVEQAVAGRAPVRRALDEMQRALERMLRS